MLRLEGQLFAMWLAALLLPISKMKALRHVSMAAIPRLK